MPVLSDVQYKQLILRETGKEADASFSGLLDLLWTLYTPMGNIAKMVQYAYTKRHAVLLAMGDVVGDYDNEELNIVRKESQKFANYEKMLKASDTHIAQLESYYNYDGAYLIGQIAKATPLEYQDVYWSPNQMWTRGLATWLPVL